MENNIFANEQYRIAVRDSLYLEPLLKGRPSAVPARTQMFTFTLKCERRMSDYSFPLIQGNQEGARGSRVSVSQSRGSSQEPVGFRDLKAMILRSPFGLLSTFFPEYFKCHMNQWSRADRSKVGRGREDSRLLDFLKGRTC